MQGKTAHADTQPGILPQPGSHASFLVLRAPPSVKPAEAREIARIVAGAPKKAAALAKEAPRAKLMITVSFGSHFWDAMSPDHKPRELHPFRAMKKGTRVAPSTGGDVFLHVVSERIDLAFELLRTIRSELGAHVTTLEDVAAFRYRDKRDITGFIDGTENPTGKARALAAFVGDEDPDFAGGSYVFVQRYIHDLLRWGKEPTHEQEKIIGRTKKDSVELPEKRMPPTSHVSRTVIEEDGKELKMVRHSFPYGNTSEAGLYFVAYMRRLSIAEHMLSRMIGTAEDGHHDRLLEFSHAVSGATFFAPSPRTLASFARSATRQK